MSALGPAPASAFLGPESPAPVGTSAWWNRPARLGVVLAVFLAFIVGLQVVRDRKYAAYRARTQTLYVPSGAVLDRLALSFDAMLADVYWMRAVNHYGSTKLSDDEEKSYELLYPLLDITTTLDPRFNIAYRFGAIFLTEAFPAGPGRPDLAVELLQKGVRQMPEKWEYLMDVGFINYWWLRDYEEAAIWFQRASEIPGSSWWLQSLAANMLTQGGSRAASRLLWQQMYETADNEWVRNEAARRLAQLDALDQIDLYARVVAAFEEREGRLPSSWQDMIAADLLNGHPVDPAGHQYLLAQRTGVVTVSPESPLFPLPNDPSGPMAR